MAYLSRYLQEALRSEHIDADTPMRVVMHMSAPAEATISAAAAPDADRGTALEVLRAAGVGGGILATAALTPHRIISGQNAVTVDIPAADLEQLAATPGIEWIRPIRIHRTHLDSSTALLGVTAPVRSRFDGRGLRVAVLDSGIDEQHPDFAGRIRANQSKNFTSEGTPDDITDRNGHGTHVAGIIGGAGATFRGVAPAVEFIICKVFNAKGRGEEGAVEEAVQWAVQQGADVINYSGGFAPVLNGRALIRPPWVWTEEPMAEEIQFSRAVNGGTVCVVSAGNEGAVGRRATISVPATDPDVIAVGATDKQRALTGFSSVGPALRSPNVSAADMVTTLTQALRPSVRTVDKVDLLAPGGGVDDMAARAGLCFYAPGIISARAQQGGDLEAVCSVASAYTRISGTSQAAPHVSGLAALVLHAARSMGADLGPNRAVAVKGILLSASSRIPNRTRPEQGRGLPAWDTIEAILGKIVSGTPITKFLK